MKYKSENYVVGEDGTKFYIGDNVRVHKENAYQFRGAIKLITSKGMYLDVGAKADKYFRNDQIDEISILE